MRSRRSAPGRPLSADGESYGSTLSRCLALAALGYATAFFGAVEPMVQYHVCLVVLGAVVVALLAPAPQPVPRPRLIAGLLVIGCAWLLFAGLQTVPLPQGLLRWLSPELVAVRESYLPAGEAAASGAAPRTLSLVPAITRAVWPVYALALAFFWLGLASVPTRRARTQLLAALAIGGTALALWGLLQRARGSDLLLPGREAPERALPFATLVYKNAGASLLIAALAAAVGLWLVALRPLLRQRRRDLQQTGRARKTRRDGTETTARAGRRGSGRADSRRFAGGAAEAYGHVRRWWLEPRVVMAMLVIAVIGAGLVASLSRGAWVAAAVALLVWGIGVRRQLSWSLLSSFGVALVVLSGVAVGSFGVRGAVVARTAQMDWDVLAENDRIGHWRDAAETFFSYPLTGAGLGTYGYAHLPSVDHDTPRWFHHAHSQPLEWAVETGMIGIAVLLAGAALWFAVLADLYRQRAQGSTPLIWFSVGVIATVGLMVQSCADFVLLTPAVMWTYALLLGAAARATVDGRPTVRGVASAAGLCHKTGPSPCPSPPLFAARRGRGEFEVSLRDRIFRFVTEPSPRASAAAWINGPHASWRSVAGLLGPLQQSAAWAAVVVIGALFVGQGWLQDHLIDQRLLELTRLPRGRAEAPSPERIERSRELLEQRLRQRPHQSQLWQRLGLWEVARYRRALLAQARRQNASVEWIRTEPRTLFQVYHALDPALRQQRRAAWLSEPVQREAVRRAREHLVNSLRNNPLVPQVHLHLAWLSPLTAQPYRHSAEKCRALSASHGDLQFELGLLARAEGDRRTMIDQWRRCLRYSPEHFDAVVRAAGDVLTPQQLAGGVLRELRANVWMSLVRRSQRQVEFAGYRQAFLDAARVAVVADAGLPEGQRQSYLASLCHYAGQSDQETVHRKRAVQADPANPHYRYAYALQLLSAGRLQQARDACTLGRALEPGAARFPALLKRIDRRLAAAAASRSRQISTLPTPASRE